MTHPNPLYTEVTREKSPIVIKDLAKVSGISVPHLYRIILYYPSQLAGCRLSTLLKIQKFTGIDLIQFTINNFNNN